MGLSATRTEGQKQRLWHWLPPPSSDTGSRATSQSHALYSPPTCCFLSLLWKLTAVCQNPLAQSTPWSTRLGGKLRELPLWERGGTRTLLLVPAVLFWAQTELPWVPVVSLSPCQPEQPWVLWLAHISAWAGHHCTALTTICWKMEQGSQWPSAANLRKQLEKYYYCSC